MLVPHGSEALRSWSISERALRAAAWATIVVAIVLVTGLGTIVDRLARLRTSPAMAATPASGEGRVGDVDSLRAQVANLDQALRMIRSADGRLRTVAGSGAPSATSDSVALMLRAEADSLLELAGRVSKGYGALADSATRRAEAGAKRSPGRPAR